MKKYTYLFLFTVTISALFSGGRLTSSDELSVFLTTESLVKRGELSINPELVANGILGRDGRFYSGAGIAQPVLSIPFFIFGDFAADIFRPSDPLRTLSVRSVVSLFNQFIAGLIAVVFFAFGLKLGYSKRLSLFLTLSLLFTTNLFPYLKSYMREPQLLLYLLTSVYCLYCFKLENKPKFLLYSGILCGIALLTRLTSVITLPVLFLYLLVILVQSRNSVSTAWVGILKGSLTFAGPIVAAVSVNAILNYLQFGSITTMPYARAEFKAPLFVGLYGLLFSSGKSFFLYAPLTILAFASISRFRKTNRTEFYVFAALFIVNVLFFAKFEAWAGDGSWGPRYLISTLPFVILPVGALIQKSKAAKRVALFLAGLGVLIQLGGVSVYLGNYMREIGEFPYTKGFEDPEFLYKSHFIPNYSPVVGHWRMLLRNLQVNFSDKRPSFSVTNPEGRIPLSTEDQKNLLYTLDFWFMYASYARIKTGVIFAIVVLLGLLSAIFGYKFYRSLLNPPNKNQTGTKQNQDKGVALRNIQ